MISADIYTVCIWTILNSTTPLTPTTTSSRTSSRRTTNLSSATAMLHINFRLHHHQQLLYPPFENIPTKLSTPLSISSTHSCRNRSLITADKKNRDHKGTDNSTSEVSPIRSQHKSVMLKIYNIVLKY